MEPYSPFDVTRPDTYQGRLHRFTVAVQIGGSSFIAAFGVAFGVLVALTHGPLWGYFAGAGFALFGLLGVGYWTRAYRRSAPGRRNPGEDGDS